MEETNEQPQTIDAAQVQAMKNASSRLGSLLSEAVEESEYFKLKLQEAQQTAQATQQNHQFLLQKLTENDIDVADLLSEDPESDEDGPEAEVTDFPVSGATEDGEDATAAS